jgi:hypothetical protein
LSKFAQIHVGKGVLAQWDGIDEAGTDVESLGKDGKFNWVCEVAPQQKIKLQLQWEVTAPIKLDIVGL